MNKFKNLQNIRERKEPGTTLAIISALHSRTGSHVFMQLSQLLFHRADFCGVAGNSTHITVMKWFTHSSRSLNDHWGIKEDLATTFLRFSLSSAFQRASPNLNLVHSDTLSSHLFFCLPFPRPPCTVPCMIIFANSFDLVMCPFHLQFASQIRSSYGLKT